MKIRKIISYIILFLIVFTIISPLIWLILISLKTRVDALTMPPNWLFNPTFVNYNSIFQGDSIKTILNSFIIAFFSSLIVILLAIPAGYTFSRLTLNRLKNSFFFFMTMRMIPPAVIIIPLFLVFSKLSLIDNYLGILLIHLAINLPIAIWLLTIIFDRTPTSVDESAMIDGANYFQILLNHIIPINKLAILIIFMLCFVLSWNEFFLGMILTSYETRPLTIELSSLLTPHGTNWGKLSALTIISFIPVLTLIVLTYYFTTNKNNE
jgi:multiple sugar transport system permease protein